MCLVGISVGPPGFDPKSLKYDVKSLKQWILEQDRECVLPPKTPPSFLHYSMPLKRVVLARCAHLYARAYRLYANTFVLLSSSHLSTGSLPKLHPHSFEDVESLSPYWDFKADAIKDAIATVFDRYKVGLGACEWSVSREVLCACRRRSSISLRCVMHVPAANVGVWRCP